MDFADGGQHLTPEARALISIPAKLDRANDLAAAQVQASVRIAVALETLNGTLQDLVEATTGVEPKYTIQGGRIVFDGLTEQ